MAQLDPQTLPLPTAGTKYLPRVGSAESGSGQFRTGDGLWQIDVRTVNGKNTVHQIKVTSKKITSDPFKPSENRAVSGYVTVNFNFPTVGFSGAEKIDIYKGLAALLAASTDASLTKLVGGEV